MYPKTLGGVQVTIDGLAAPLLYVSESQINAVVPFGVLSRRKVAVQVVNGTSTLPDFTVLVGAAMPEIFSRPDGVAIINQDGSANSQTRPAKAGSAVSIWLTGGRTPSTPPLDGMVAAGPSRYDCADIALRPTPQTLVYAGAAPGIVAGVCQVVFEVPLVQALSRYFVEASVDNWASGEVTLWVEP